MLAISLTALALLILNWVGYPLTMAAVGRGRRKASGRLPSEPPSVAVIIATRDPPETVLRRVNDVRVSRYPAARLEVIVAVDARSPHSPADHAQLVGDRAIVVLGDAPGGKAAALNAGVRGASADILVFTDSYQRFAPDAIPQLVQFLGDERYGSVSGAVVHEGHRLLDLYWEYEMLIRRGQSALHSIANGTGQIQAIRRKLWEPLPPELIADDLYMTMRLVLRGGRVGFTPSARAFDPRQFTDRQLFWRRVRTLTGLVQFIAWMPAALLPWRNPIWVHFVCHKLMRLVTPYFAMVAVLGLVWVLLEGLGAALWWPIGAGAVLLLTLAALYPRAMKRAGRRLSSLVLLLVAPVIATLNGLQKRWHVWPPYQPPQNG